MHLIGGRNKYVTKPILQYTMSAAPTLVNKQRKKTNATCVGETGAQ